MGNRLVTVGVVLGLMMPVGGAMAAGVDDTPVVPADTAARTDAETPERGADDAVDRAATDDAHQGAGVAAEAPAEATAEETPEPVTGQAAQAAEPADTAIIAPIGDEALDAEAPGETLLAGDFPAIDPSAPACREDTILMRGDFGKVRFSVKVADDGPERAQGLMNVKSMPPSVGMLFVYPSARPVAFWMKNTLIPLDMIFADQNGVVQRVHSMAKPRDLTQIPGGDSIQYVLEINGGMANMLGIKPGSQMRHPSIADPAWRCN